MKDNQQKILPTALVRRLPAYYRNICIMEMEGKTVTTSRELAERIGNTSAQVRQDFFTCGGVPGYNLSCLKKWLSGLIGLEKQHRMVVVGAGNLGRAIISFREFNQDGFFIDAVFDNNLMYNGMQICNVPILNAALFSDYLEKNPVDIVVIATPASAAPEIFEKAVAGGVKGIWNFAPVDLVSDGDISIQNVHLSDTLMMLSFRMEESLRLEDPKEN